MSVVKGEAGEFLPFFVCGNDYDKDAAFIRCGAHVRFLSHKDWIYLHSWEVFDKFREFTRDIVLTIRTYEF